jgi:hypothetical protein
MPHDFSYCAQCYLNPTKPFSFCESCWIKHGSPKGMVGDLFEYDLETT